MPRKGRKMNQSPRLPEHPCAQEEYLHLQETCDTIARETAETEALTGAKAGVHMDVQMKEDPDQEEEVTIQLVRAKLDRLRQLTMAAEQAYFARLDFIPEKSRQETYYLGRWGVLDPATLDPVVIDWRSPVANLYYSGQIGPMDYEAPDGRVRGELTLKPGLPMRLKISDETAQIRCEGETVQTAASRPLNEDQVRRQLGKTGESDFTAESQRRKRTCRMSWAASRQTGSGISSPPSRRSRTL